MQKPRYILFAFLFTLLINGCGNGVDICKLSVNNEMNLDRQESLEIPKTEFGNIPCEYFSSFAIRDRHTEKMLPVQFVDQDLDGKLDYLIFQPYLAKGETREYEIFTPEKEIQATVPENRTFSRFVPERTDDYAWENDRVAFRTYGPEAQRMIEENIPGGTLSSGIDCWLKRVNYPIIDKWYKKHLEEGGSYHEDTGEGLDDFHVGPSRGCGGTGVWDVEEKILYTSKNFTGWRTFAEGPLRTLFELDYAPWEYPGGVVKEKKIISLDMGSNLMCIEVRFDPENTPETITAGITLHEKDGSIVVDERSGWFSCWQPHAGSELGMGIVVEPKYLEGYTEHMVEEKDRSHLLVHMKPIENSVVYYAGFGWSKSGRFNNQKEWVAYLADFGRGLESGLRYNISK